MAPDTASPPPDTMFPEKPAATEGGSKKVNNYTVSKFDTLWKISGKKRVYADSFQWPLLFIANKDQINDPDLIKPGMKLKVSRGQDADKVADAVKKAKDTPRFEPHAGPREKLPVDY